MADYDAKSKSKVMAVIAPAVIAADNTPVAIDTAGFRGATIGSHVGIGGITFDATNKLEIKLLAGDDTTYGNAVAVTADEVVMPYGETLGTGGIIRSFTAEKAAADTEVHTVGYIGKKRYLYVLLDFSGTHGSGTPIAVDCRLCHADVNPIWQSSIEV